METYKRTKRYKNLLYLTIMVSASLILLDWSFYVLSDIKTFVLVNTIFIISMLLIGLISIMWDVLKIWMLDVDGNSIRKRNQFISTPLLGLVEYDVVDNCYRKLTGETTFNAISLLTRYKDESYIYRSLLKLEISISFFYDYIKLDDDDISCIVSGQIDDNNKEEINDRKLDNVISSWTLDHIEIIEWNPFVIVHHLLVKIMKDQEMKKRIDKDRLIDLCFYFYLITNDSKYIDLWCDRGIFYRHVEDSSIRRFLHLKETLELNKHLKIEIE